MTGSTARAAPPIIAEEDEDVEWADGLKADDINDILGFDLSTEESQDRSGLLALINSALVSHRRLPMLDVIFDRAARLLTTNLRHLTNDNVEVTLDAVASTRFGEFITALPTPSVVGVVKAASLDNYFLVALDASFVYSTVDLLLGGRRSGGSGALDRNFTQIELALTEKVLRAIVAELAGAFAPIVDVAFELDRIETTPRFAAIAQDASVSSLAKYRVTIEDRSGRIAVLMPHATLEPVHKQLAREFIGEASSSASLWRDHLRSEINASRVIVDVIAGETEMSIGALGDLSIGDTITFSEFEKGTARLRANGADIATVRIGRNGDRIAVRAIAPPEVELASENDDNDGYGQ